MQLYIGEIKGSVAEISGDEFLHFSKVLRGKIGQKILITDGLGNLASGTVTRTHSQFLEMEIEELKTNFEQRNYRLHIAIAPTKSMDRIEFFLEKATEIGIDEITFLKTFHSERKNINLERCQKIINSAVKQSLKAYVPKLNGITKFSDFINQNHQENKFIAHCNDDFPRPNIKSIISDQNEFLFIIGPEGDFSNHEITMAQNAEFKGVSLGNQRYRTETAALHSVFLLDFILN